MHIGILTGGGDVPGLNPCIKALVNRAIDSGHKVTGLRRGWAGVLHYDPVSEAQAWECAVPLDKQRVRTIDRSGGTFLHTSRTNPAKVRPHDVPEFLRDNNWSESGKPRDFTEHVLKVIDAIGIDILIPIGGDDTLSYAKRLHEESIDVVAIPKTMDNDVFGTDYCIGFSTAVTRSVNFIHNLRTSTGSHERIAVIELFGRNSGETSLIAAYLSGVDRAVISEIPFDPEKLADLLVEDKSSNPSNYAMVTVSEGAKMLGGEIVESGERDAFGHKKLGGIGLETSEFIKQYTGHNTLYQMLSYLMRSGAPDSLDLMVALNFAHMTMDLIDQKVYGRMVALRNGVYTDIPMNEVLAGVKRVDVDELYDVENYKPKVRHVSGMPMFLR